MLIPLTILERESASGPVLTRDVALNPNAVARIEETEYDGRIVCEVWCDGMEKPYRVPSGIMTLLEIVNGYDGDGDSTA